METGSECGKLGHKPEISFAKKKRDWVIVLIYVFARNGKPPDPLLSYNVRTDLDSSRRCIGR